jgi:pimeloyl-ACP methyl ester carboxylesterase
MPSVSVDGTSLFYRQVGSGPDVVMVHGLAADHGYWYVRCAPQLASDFTVTMYDLRGHGLSSVPRTGYTTRVMAEDLAALLEQLGIRSAHVVGHSFGGAVALQLALRPSSPVSSLTIADAPVPGLVPPVRAREWAGWPMWKKHLGDVGIKIDPDDPLDYRIISRLVSGTERSERQEPWQLGRRQRKRWEKLLATTTAAEEFGHPAGLTRSAVRRISQPIELIYGALSFCLPAGRRLEQLLPSARMVVLPGVGHFFPVTRPSLLTDRIREFIGSLQESP